MQISELSAATGLSVPTIKFYLREGLLAPGQAVSATRASYDESHVRRLRLIRALVDVAGMKLDGVHQVLAAVDDPTLTLHEAIGSAHTRLSGDGGASPSQESSARVDRMLRRWRWRGALKSRHRDRFAHSLDVLDELGNPVSDEMLTTYASAMRTVADAEVATIEGRSREEASEKVVIGTLLVEPLLVQLRRLAHEDVSSRRLRSHR